MESIIRNVRDIDGRERQMLEHVLGQPLTENQRVIIHVETVVAQPAAEENGKMATTKLPAWCDVYAGLTDDEIAEVEAIALSRAEMSRPSE